MYDMAVSKCLDSPLKHIPLEPIPEGGEQFPDDVDFRL
jgi:hypothetical protein